ncbi:MAG: single-stranded DNA-binding protein [Bacteroidales bacterium]|nr:single-stranded DNA-binding protein [Bacteroidales bacterium]
MNTFLNKIEIKGYVGSVALKDIQGTKMARFSVATELAYTGRDGSPIVEITWFNCTAWESERIKDLEKIQKGKLAHVIGRIRANRYTDNNGVERSTWEVIVFSVKIEED